MFVPLDLILGKIHIGSGRVADNKRHTRRVGAVLFYHIKRVDDVAERLTHLLAIFITHKSVKVHGFKGNVSQKIACHQYHACHPEENNVVARLKDRSRVVYFKVLCFLGPSKC